MAAARAAVAEAARRDRRVRHHRHQRHRQRRHVRGHHATIALWIGEADRYPTLLSIVRRHADIARAKKEGTLGLILGFQNTEMLERDLSRLDVFHRLGVRIIQLTYNDRNLVGDGCLEPGDAGLSAFGRQVVERMNELGIAVDLSHCGTRTTADGIAASTKPPLITHSGCREVYRHPRSKEDRELKAMADKGGVIGIYFMPFIGPGTGAPTVEMLMRQIDHALKVCGADHVGIGSDLSTTPIEETPEYLREHKSFVDGSRRARHLGARRSAAALHSRAESPTAHRGRGARRWPQRGHSADGHREGDRRQLPPRAEGDLGPLVRTPVAYKDSTLRLLKQLVAIDSVNPSLVPRRRRRSGHCAALVDELRSIGLDTTQEAAPGRRTSSACSKAARRGDR